MQVQAVSVCGCYCRIERTASSHLAGVSCGLCLLMAETMRLTFVPSAGLCTTVVWASWGEVGDTLPCREGDGWEREEEEKEVEVAVVRGTRKKGAEEDRRARLTRVRRL